MRGGASRAHKRDDLYQLFDKIEVLGCLVALYGSTMHPARFYGGFWTIFFCLVCGPLEKKKGTGKKKSLRVYKAYHATIFIWARRMSQN